ncbi:MAG: tetraacyldisaccharide 4'-kinase [Phycisphaerae bacterium]|nr:tetraacyldisaccharide 4'-kinase [Phycisphaerae bacterium]
MTAADDKPMRPPLRGPVGRVVSWVYGTAVRRRNSRFDQGRGIIRLDRPVISVGNLSVGGTGKTPMVVHFCRVLLAAGHDPCIAMRGYRATPEGVSDEARVYERELPGVPVIAQPNRADGLIDFFTTERGEGVDSVVLDDGFQHRQLARDLDIVLIDAMRDPWRDRLLPAGWLREPPESLARAGAIVITHAEAVPHGTVSKLLERARAAAPGAVLAACGHAWDCLLTVDDTERPVSALRGRRIAVCCGIGNPDAFERQAAAAAGGAPVYRLILRDHDPFAPGTIAALLRGAGSARAEYIVVTEKDWTKLTHVNPEAWPCPVVRPRLSLTFDRGGRDLEGVVLDRAQGQDE